MQTDFSVSIKSYSVVTIAILNCTLTVQLFSSNNYTWGLAYELCWMYVELSGSVICASASTLKPLFTHFLPYLVRSRFTGTSGNGRSRDRTGAIELSSSRKANTKRSKKQQKKSVLRTNGAFELDSGDESELGRKPTTSNEDETKLWTAPPANHYRPDEPLEDTTNTS